MAKTLIAFFSRADENYFGGSERTIRQCAPEAALKKGLSVLGSGAASSGESVKRWLKANGIL